MLRNVTMAETLMNKGTQQYEQAKTQVYKGVQVYTEVINSVMCYKSCVHVGGFSLSVNFFMYFLILIFAKVE